MSGKASATLAERGYGMVYCADATRLKLRLISATLGKPMYELSDKYLTPQVERDFLKLFPNGAPKLKRQSARNGNGRK